MRQLRLQQVQTSYVRLRSIGVRRDHSTARVFNDTLPAFLSHSRYSYR